MTAFDNIKVNNWPATSNDFEDFLVFKTALNDNASLTESLSVGVGSQELFPKRTLTNTGVNAQRAGVRIDSAATITGSAWSANDTFQWAFREGYDTYGQPQTAKSAAFASNGGTYKIVFANGGYSVSQNIVLKFYINGGNIKVNAGETDEQEWTTTDGSSFQTWTIASSSVSQLKNVQLTNDTNTGPYWSGIYVDGVQLVNPPGGSKKHYDNNADYSSGRLDLENSLFTEDPSLTFGSGDFTIEAWVNISDTTASNPIFCGQADGTSTPGSAYIFTADTTHSRTSRIHVGSTVYSMTWGADFNADQWYHLAFVRDGSKIRIYRDGVQANNTNVGSSSVHNTGSTTYKPSVGSMVFAGNRYNFQGKIQDLRVYKGLCKYPSGTSFTPPGAILG